LILLSHKKPAGCIIDLFLICEYPLEYASISIGFQEVHLFNWRRCTINDTVLLLFVGLACLLAGYLVGKANSIEQPTKDQDEGQSKKSAKPDMAEAGRIWRNMRSGDFYPELDGKVFHSPSEMTDNQRARFSRLLEVLQSWMKPSDDKPVVGQPVLQVGATGKASDEPLPVLEEKRISYNPIKVFTDAIGTDANKPKSENMSIVAQIDEILQEKLEKSPLAKRGISMKDSLDGGLLVWVGLQQYASIDEVPDPEIRQLLRQSVEEWERRLDK
jgi:hypothetical protein